MKAVGRRVPSWKSCDKFQLSLCSKRLSLRLLVYLDQNEQVHYRKKSPFSLFHTPFDIQMTMKNSCFYEAICTVESFCWQNREWIWSKNYTCQWMLSLWKRRLEWARWELRNGLSILLLLLLKPFLSMLKPKYVIFSAKNLHLSAFNRKPCVCRRFNVFSTCARG